MRLPTAVTSWCCRFASILQIGSVLSLCAGMTTLYCSSPQNLPFVFPVFLRLLALSIVLLLPGIIARKELASAGLPLDEKEANIMPRLPFLPNIAPERFPEKGSVTKPDSRILNGT